MSAGVGPRRLILIRSAGYDYAELELDEAVHLVAPNNAGKTSLIAALQFLYIDRIDRMHFAHPSPDTRRHYFPESNSFVLFECDTPSGLQVVAIRGLGPARGYEFQRLVYRGAYAREHFIDNGSVRTWEEIRTRLVEFDMDTLEAQGLRKSLLGTSTGGRAPLHILPLRRTSAYGSFHVLFRNLLRLARLDQNDLKNLFVDGARIDPRDRRVDLRSEVAGLYDKLTRQLERVERLKRVKPQLDGLVEAFDERCVIRNELVARWRALDVALGTERAGLAATILASKARTQTANDIATSAKEEFQELGARLQSLAGDEGRVVAFLTDLDTQRERFKDFQPQLEAQAVVELQRRRDALGARISQSQTGDRAHLAQRLRSLKSDATRDAALVERFSEAVVTWLRTESALDEATLAEVFRLLNPALLGAFIAEGGIEIDDAKALDKRLREIAAHFTNGAFHGAGLRIPADALGDASPFADYEDLETVRTRLTGTQKEIDEVSRRLADLERIEELRREAAGFDTELGVRRARRIHFEEWQRNEESREAKTALRESLRAELAGVSKAQDTARMRVEAAHVAAANAEREARAAETRVADLTARTSRLVPPPSEWCPAHAGAPEEHANAGEAEEAEVSGRAEPSAIDAPSTADAGRSTGPLDGQLDTPLDEQLDRYERGRDRERRAHGRFEHASREVETETSGRYRRATEDETIATLRDALDAIPDREAAVQEMWSKIVTTVKSRFNGLLRGVDSLGDHVRKLNRALALRKVSNLERVEVLLVRQDDLIARLRAVVDLDEAPLFGAAGGRTRAYADVQRWLEDRPEIDVHQLFGIRFRIVDRNGREKTFASLSQIESQGTSTTIKVLVHLELLKMLLADTDVSMPFFLDEVATLDDKNLRALIEHAKAMGFVPVVASPEARDCVERLYFLIPNAKGGLVLDDAARLTIHHPDTTDAPAPPPDDAT